MNANIKFWIVGIALAVVGVVLARLVSIMFSDRVGIQLLLYFAGVFIALSGLGVVLYGLRKK